MVIRFCPTCAAEVEEADGFCLLGHPLGASTAPTSSIRELREEVERAFEDARLEVAAAMAPLAERAGGNGSGAASADDPPPPPPRRLPPPPPPPQVFDSLRSHEPVASDPISAFAPSPRMDWGPQDKVSKLRRKGS